MQPPANAKRQRRATRYSACLFSQRRFLVLNDNPMIARIIDAEVGHDGDHLSEEDQAVLVAVGDAERSQKADFLDDSMIESDNIGHYNSTDLFGSESDQEELVQLTASQRTDQEAGRPALGVSGAAAIRQAATEPQVRRNDAMEAALDNVFGNSGAGGFQPAVLEFVQMAQEAIAFASRRPAFASSMAQGKEGSNASRVKHHTSESTLTVTIWQQ